MATYSSNTTIKFDSAVSLSAQLSTQSYTVPANCYLVLGICKASTSGGVGGSSIAISGQTVVYADSSQLEDKIFGGIHVGAGQSVVVSSNTFFAVAFASGVLFRNSP